MTAEYSIEEVAKHTSKDDCWFIIEGVVYDVTKFLDEHPGGDDVLIEVAGKDATTDFEDIGHSDEAIAQLSEFKIGTVKGGKPSKPSSGYKGGISKDSKGDSSSALYLLIALIIVAAVAYPFIFPSNN
eukprot:CAMPEP_0201509360 /NCGR_PEP_ID=MMETSP0161_2-20130828/2435_1 /ASSEMBLY_ACC=CAM_ASM_000251 /TAXON_ID=180227 /ORGANISM="Neoparamoeba aestuarina, Strain SoJaBio B1-5/56/2" /LENGTH=127 /DNA_ID=CAMNT_0047904287 /DNA_START=62 /DNA_END=445 /DNA_ORIENTATION=-